MSIVRYGPSIQVTATTTSTAYALPSGREYGSQVEVVNRGPNNIYIALGGSDITVAAPTSSPSNALLVPPGAVLATEVAYRTHIAVLAETGTAKVMVHQGN